MNSGPKPAKIVGMRLFSKSLSLLALLATLAPLSPEARAEGGPSPGLEGPAGPPSGVFSNRPAVPARRDQKPLREKELESGAFRLLQQMTGASVLDLRLLYEMSTARNFKDFSRALFAARALQLDHNILLRSIGDRSIEDAIQEFGITRDQAKETVKAAKKELEKADKEWKKQQHR